MKLFNAIEKHIRMQQAKINACLKEGDKNGAMSLRAQLNNLQEYIQAEISPETQELIRLTKLIHELRFEVLDE